MDIFFRMARQVVEVLKKERKHEESKSRIRKITIEREPNLWQQIAKANAA